jgi:hypothetical protein
MRDELQFRILVSIREDQLQGLDDMSRKAMQSIVESNKQLATAMTSQTEKIIQRQDVDSSLASTRHNEVLHAITKRSSEKYSIEDVPGAVMDKLYFARKDDRYDDIVTAHQNTFNWALESDDSADWPNLADWLREDGGVYWISGKAGSGKSTLMKYLYQDPRFMKSLNVWAGGDHLIVADYYFWSSGAEIQRSQEGLLRSLLWQVLKQDISLASTLFAEQFLSNAEWDEFPTFHQLRRAFGRLLSHPLTSMKIAIVVDGLDEFDARRITMTELGEMFIAATEGGKIKALLSSRPLTEFTDCFASQPQMELQQLTHNDITKYVDESLSAHSQMVYLKAAYEEETKALVGEIVSSASGVFLWITLVVRSLLQGLQNGDMIEDLQVRLRALPKDLEALFTHMLRNVSPLYKSQAACIFQILRCNDEGRPVRSLSAVRLSYAEMKTEEIISADISPLLDEDLERIETIAERRLRSRCAGLLELRMRGRPWRNSTKKNTWQSRLRGKPRQSQTGIEEQTGRKDVVYLHRTVADFLHQKEVWEDLISHAEGLEFHPSLAVLQSLVMGAKTVKPQPAYLDVPWELVSDVMLFARLTEAKTQTSSRRLLDEFDRAITNYFPDVTVVWAGGKYKGTTWCDTWKHTDAKRIPCYDNFMALAVVNGLTLYVQDTIRVKGRICLDKPGRPLLDYACRPDPNDGFRAVCFDFNIAKYLLLASADPNAEFNGLTTWQNCLYTGFDDPIRWVPILKLLLVHGADTNAGIGTEQAPRTALEIVQEDFDDFLARNDQRNKQGYDKGAITGPVSAEQLAQLKLEIIELKGMLTKKNTKGVQGKVGSRSSRTSGEWLTLLGRRLLGRGHK